jgi:hypothetical protein
VYGAIDQLMLPSNFLPLSVNADTTVGENPLAKSRLSYIDQTTPQKFQNNQKN